MQSLKSFAASNPIGKAIPTPTVSPNANEKEDRHEQR